MSDGLKKDYDVIVVGSGAAGGMAAWALTKAGVSVLMLESGRDYDPISETPMFNPAGAAPLHGAATPDKEQGYFDATVGGGNMVPGEPFTKAEGTDFKWWRARMLGGRTNHWGRMSPRFGPYDFKGATRDGLGVDWPISYDDIAPWYDKVESLIGVFGEAEGIENSPDSPPGILHRPPPPRAFETWVGKVMKGKHNLDLIPAHMAILTREHNGRPSCFYASDCLRGCSIGANFQSTTVLIPPAMATNKLDIRTDAHVFEVVMGAKGRATGVRYIDRKTGDRHEVRARAVMLGASTAESARILLQSKSTSFPQGLANGSGHVGRNLIDTPSVGVAAQVPQLEGLPTFDDYGVSLFHTYVPWWGYDQQRAGQLNFSRGYHIDMWGGRRQPEMEDISEIAKLTTATGPSLHAEMKRLYGSIVYIMGRGEMIPNADSYCELDSETTDQWGLPVAKFHWKWGDEEKASCTHQRQTIGNVFRSMRANIMTDMERPIEQAMGAGGRQVHEAGAARMSASEDTGVLNADSRAWEVDNLYVIDGAAFASMPDKNPTLTILALSWRAADHLTKALGRGDL